MRRILILLMALALAMVAPATAEGNRLLKLEDGGYMSGMMSDGDALYIAGESKLYIWRDGDDAPAAYTSAIRLPDESGEVADIDRNFYEFRLFADDGGLHGINIAYDESYEPEALLLFDIATTDEGTVEARNARRIDLPEALRAGNFYLEAVCARAGLLYLLVSDESGTNLAVIDPQNPKAAASERLDNSWDCKLVPSKDGVLLTFIDYRQEPVPKLCAVNSDGSMDELCTLPNGAQALAADLDTGALYAVVEGRLRPVDAATGEVGEPVAALPSDPRYGVLVNGGRTYAAGLEGGVALLDTEGHLAEDRLLTIQGGYYGTWLDAALMAYSVEHPEITPVMGHDYQNVLDDIMAQSPQTDIYMLDYADNGVCEALQKRGYMLPLDGSEALNAFAERIYPRLREKLISDGRLAALPLQLGASCMGMSSALLEKMGLSVDAVPGDWPGFLDFLENEVRPQLSVLGEKDKFTYDGMNAVSFARFMKQRALEDFIQVSEAAGSAPNFLDPRLQAVLERLEAIDFTDYGLPDELDEDGYGYGWNSEDKYLIQFDAPVGFGQGMSTDCTPMPLGYGEDLPGVLPVRMSVAFVNPYSAHAAEAIAFLEDLAGSLPAEVTYMLCADLNEPVRSPDAERVMAEYQKYIDQAKADLENMEPSQRQASEEDIRNMEESYDSYLKYDSWLIPEDQLTWYRANSDRLAVAAPSWFQKDTSGEAWQLMQQFFEGQMSPREFLAAVNQRARMMAMEEG